MFTHLYRQSISCILSTVLLSNMLYGSDLAVDSTAAAIHQAGLDVTANGIPLVNIVTPNTAGLSHNKFSDFNVNPVGLILNNATGITSTQLGGFVQGNANLGTTPARVILSEVTGTSRTLLRGFTEVAGHSADVIIANPNGITVNGGGFINTPRATLTTGTPNYSGGVYQGLNVGGGDILIEGDGMVADNIDRVDLYTKNLQLNAKIHAKRLDVITGENDIVANGSTYTPQNTTGTETYSIDSSALGGIYANAITLIATDRGVGVNLPEITYASDSLILSADGHIVLGAAVSDNTLSSTSESLTVNSLLRSKNTMNLKATDTLRIAPNSVILSGGDITIHDTGTLRNEAGRIEADNDLSIQASTIENFSSMTPTKTTQYIGERHIGNNIYRTESIDSINKDGYTLAYLLAGRDMLLDGAIHNRYSMIAADRDLYLSGSLNNEAALNAHMIIDERTWIVSGYQTWVRGKNRWIDTSHWDNFTHTDTITDHVYSTISAGRNLLGNLAAVNNADIIQGSNYSSIGVAPISYARNLTTGEITYTLPDGKNGEFTLAANPALPYLIETNQLFTDYNTFVSSDYIMSRLNLNMASDTKRLGDARYETQLVRDAVFRLMGERYLAGFGSDTQQYQALMDNAISVSENLQLALGVSLSSSQLAALDRDIVWMEERMVEGQKVLVPKIYLASLKDSILSEGGKIVAANDIQLAVAGELNNAGEIRAGGILAATADTITNSAGSITSTGDMFLHTTGDITNTSGKISGNNVALLSDNGSITAQTTHQQIDLSNHTGTTGHFDTVGESAGIWAQGNLVANADKNINLVGGETAAGGNIDLSAQNITLTSLEQSSRYKTTWNKGSSEIESVKQHAASLNAGGDVNLNSTKDITINSSAIASGNNVNLTSGENVNLTASNDRQLRDVQTSSKGFMSKKSTRDMSLKETVASSNITGENITINSEGDTTLQAANLIAAQNIQIDAAGDINILAKAYREATLHEESKSSLGGLSKSMSLDITDAVKLHEATVKTTAQYIILNSGKDINIIASEVNSAADVQLKAFEDLNIIAGEESSSVQHVSKKSSFNPLGLISLVDPLAGAILKPSIYTQETHQKDNYDTAAKSSSISAGGNINAQTGTTNIVGSNIAAQGDVIIKADIGGINVASAQELHNASTLDKKTEIKLTDVLTSHTGAYKGLGNDTKLKFNIASATFDEVSTTAKSVTNKASSITSGKNIILDSSDDLAIKGSALSAVEDITLSSRTGNIAITESVDTTSIQTKEKQASADVNLVVQNEFVETGVAVKSVVEAAEQLKKVKEDYNNYKRETKKLEASLETLKADPQVSESDIANLQGLITMTKDDEAYYIAAIAAATVNLASKSVAIAQQVTAAGASTATAGFSAGLSLDMKGSKTSTDTTATKSNASNLNGKNINIATESTKDTSTTIRGSNVQATDTLNITTHDLNILASTDTATSNSDSKDISGSVSMTVYGAATGPQVSLGYGQNSARSSSTTHTNSTLTGNIVNLNATNDATFKGATVRADDTLNINVVNNLTVASVQDTSSSTNHGFNISGGFGFGSDPVNTSNNTDKAVRKVEQGKLNQIVGARTGDGTVASVNSEVGFSNGRSFDTQTVLTSLTGDTVNITTGANTKLSGALIAATDAQGNDTGNLNLATKTLTTENLTDTHYNSQSGFSVGANIGLTPSVKEPKPDTKNPKDKTTTTINSPRLSFNTSREVSVGKTLATLGSGNLNITDTASSSDTTHLNRDVIKVDKALYSSAIGTNIDATLDTRLLTVDGRGQIKQEYKDMDKNMKAVSDTLPNANSDNKVEAMAGKIWDNIAGYLSLGILPSHANNGGLLSQIPGLSGNPDSSHEILGDQNSKNVYIDGILNTASDAMQGGDNIIGKDTHKRIWINPTHGILGDLIESGVDLIGNDFGIQTGISRQAQLFQENNKDLNIHLHSQGHLVAKEGAKSSKDNGHTYFSYGAPMSEKNVEKVFNNQKKSLKDIQQNEGDYVSHPLNIFIPSTWSMSGHSTENYGASQEKNKIQEVLK
ncbi:MAG: hemagglutinin repeat-containing protein [Sulfuricurvum sp.]|nr:hemagglutinin repeat-containing protein [Sulfuricurvum sp.]MDP3023315.1 hemagglutinin repeat-containing protein [Sulfuricurvum sp.]